VKIPDLSTLGTIAGVYSGCSCNWNIPYWSDRYLREDRRGLIKYGVLPNNV